MLEKALAVLNTADRGPRGGDLNFHPNRNGRQASFDGKMTENGTFKLHRFKETAVAGRLNEQPWHRMAAYMLNAGRTNSEIAMAANVAPATVAHIKGQRWFQELCATIANTFGEELIGFIQSEAMESVNEIVRIRDDCEVPARTRLAAAQLILEQAAGKPVQKILSNVTHNVSQSPQEEMAEIELQLKALRKAEAREV